MADKPYQQPLRPNKKTKKSPSTDHVFRKRAPQKPQNDARNVFYVSTKSSTKALLDKCNKLINDSAEIEIFIYCLGAAVQRGILLALQICENHPTYQLHTNTLTTELVDDLEPAVDEADYEIQRRFNSALCIKLTPKQLLD